MSAFIEKITRVLTGWKKPLDEDRLEVYFGVESPRADEYRALALPTKTEYKFTVQWEMKMYCPENDKHEMLRMATEQLRHDIYGEAIEVVNLLRMDALARDYGGIIYHLKKLTKMMEGEA